MPQGSAATGKQPDPARSALAAWGYGPVTIRQSVYEFVLGMSSAVAAACGQTPWQLLGGLMHVAWLLLERLRRDAWTARWFDAQAARGLHVSFQPFNSSERPGRQWSPGQPRRERGVRPAAERVAPATCPDSVRPLSPTTAPAPSRLGAPRTRCSELAPSLPA
jgi:hypothetical protein